MATPTPPPEALAARLEGLHCTFWLKAKRRFCGLLRPPGVSDFCHEHGPISAPSSKRARADPATRVACPLDPRHTVRADKLQKHLKVCTTAREAAADAAQSFVVPGVNVPGLAPAGSLPAPPPSGDPLLLAEVATAEQLGTLLSELEAAYKAASAAGRTGEGGPPVPAGAPPSTAEKHTLQQAALLEVAAQRGLLAPEFPVVELGAGKGGAGLAAAQHPAMGGAARVVLVDRGAFRNKADAQLRRMQAATPPTVAGWRRLRCDITDLWLPGADLAADEGAPCARHAAPASAAGAALPPAQRRATYRTLALAKHLCGGGTDVALRALAAAEAWATTGAVPPALQAPGEEGRAQFPVPALAGLVMATCCHHRCAWSSYVGQAWWRSVGLSPLHFAVASWASGWQGARWGRGAQPSQEAQTAWLNSLPLTEPPSTEDSAAAGAGSGGNAAGGAPAAKAAAGGHAAAPRVSHLAALVPALDLAPARRLALGRMSKRLIDAGRVAFVGEVLFPASPVRQQVYCSGLLTLENVALVAGGSEPTPAE